jgi:hypothetical protein
LLLENRNQKSNASNDRGRGIKKEEPEREDLFKLPYAGINRIRFKGFAKAAPKTGVLPV